MNLKKLKKLLNVDNNLKKIIKMKAKKYVITIITFGLCLIMSFSPIVKGFIQQNIITGTWVLESNTDNYKLIFTQDNICKEFNDGNQVGTYRYQITMNSCGAYHANKQLYLKLVDTKDNDISCFEISNISQDVLSLINPDNAHLLFFNKQK